MRILIVGAGVGGLALAALLRQRGIDCFVVERAERFADDGHVISLYPMGSRVLHGMGAYGDFLQLGSALGSYEIYNGAGELLHRFDMQPCGVVAEATRQILRGDLVGLLLRHCEGVEIRTACEVAGMDCSDKGVDVRLTDGTSLRVDGVVGCDGIRSAIRALGFSGGDPEDTGWKVALWWSETGGEGDGTIRETWGRGWLVGTYPAGGRTALALAAPREGFEDAVLSGRLPQLGGNAAALVAAAAGSGSPPSIWSLSDLRATHFARGRLALLGDAACSFPPLAGTGASMALESAAVLADELSRCDAAGLPVAFTLYEKRRLPRLTAAQEEARRLAAWMTTESAAVAWTRDLFLKFAPSDSPAALQARKVLEPI